jgi:hypothetical protein
LPKPSGDGTIADMQTKRKRDWLDDLFDSEAAHPVALASPRALLEARMIEAMDKARRPRRAKRKAAASRKLAAA